MKNTYQDLNKVENVLWNLYEYWAKLLSLQIDAGGLYEMIVYSHIQPNIWDIIWWLEKH